jgi:hypothetical protein
MKSRHLNQVLERKDYNRAMQQLFDVVGKMLKDHSGIACEDEHWTQEIINVCEETIIDGLKKWKADPNICPFPGKRDGR